ncbi:RNA polymerase II subunit A C-terminal domain phosphatase SSU72, partial [Galemys pyrenaicus]
RRGAASRAPARRQTSLPATSTCDVRVLPARVDASRRRRRRARHHFRPPRPPSCCRGSAAAGGRPECRRARCGLAMPSSPLRVAVVCSSNQNRSMEAHNILSKRGFSVRSFGTGTHVKLPGPAPDKPNVYDFKTTYDQMYNDLLRKDKELYPSGLSQAWPCGVPGLQAGQSAQPLLCQQLDQPAGAGAEWSGPPGCGGRPAPSYTQNGILHMLDRNKRIKPRPERFQSCKDLFDLILTCEERVYDQVVEGECPRAGRLAGALGAAPSTTLGGLARARARLPWAESVRAAEASASLRLARPVRSPADLNSREQETCQPVHVINVDIQDNHEEATLGAFLICELCQCIQHTEDMENEIEELLQEFEEKSGRAFLHTVCFY